MRYFRLSSDFYHKHFDAYEEHVCSLTADVWPYLDSEGVTFETLVAGIQSQKCDGHKAGQPEIALSLVLLIQAGLVVTS